MAYIPKKHSKSIFSLNNNKHNFVNYIYNYHRASYFSFIHRVHYCSLYAVILKFAIFYFIQVLYLAPLLQFR